MSTRQSRLWLTSDGKPVSCVEKLKMMDQCLAEFEAGALDILEDAALMGCDVEQVREALHDILARVSIRWNK